MNLLKARGKATLFTLFLLFLGFIYLSMWKVPTGHRGVLLVFGRVRPDPFLPGLHMSLPSPIAEIRIVPVDLVQQVRIQADDSAVFNSQSNEFLTGDENLLQAEIQVDYRISDVLESARAGMDRTQSSLKLLARAQLTETLALKPVATVIGLQRAEVAQQISRDLQIEADRLGLGVQIINTAWLNLAPPDEVKADFEATQSAFNAAAQATFNAKSSANSESQKSRGLAAEIRNLAMSDAAKKLAQANFEADRFKALLNQAQRSGMMLTAKQLWLDTVNQIMPSLKSRTVLATDQPVDLTVISSQGSAETLKPKPEQ